MKTLLRLEWIKLRCTWLFLPIFFLPLISILFGTVNYVNNQEVLQREWLSLWTQIYLFFGAIFYPSLLGLILASVWAGEHRHQGLKLLLTSSYKPRDFLLAKISISFILALFSQLILLGLYTMVGLILGFQMAFPIYILGYGLLSIVFIMPILAFQSYLSLRSKSFAAPILVAMLLGLVGFIISAQNVLPDLVYLFPFSKFSLSINQLETAHLAFTSITWVKLVISSLFLSLLFLYLQHRYMKKIIS